MLNAIFAVDPQPQDKLGDTLKIVQIAFYITAGIIAVLTYRAAKRGWLTPTNTEYQKRVMDRLSKLSEDLYAEFDHSSDKCWIKCDPVREGIARMNQNFEESKSAILKSGEWICGIPVTSDVIRLQNLLNPVVSDPFIPDNIREAVVDLLSGRISSLHDVYIAEFRKYGNALATGKRQPANEMQVGGIHNAIIHELRQRGCGWEQLEKAVHDIRGLIQGYFDSFNPHGTLKGYRKKRETSVNEE